MKFWVKNKDGVIIHATNSLEKALAATNDFFAEKYIHDKLGKRPVIERWIDGIQSVEIGEYGQSVDDLMVALGSV